MIKCERCEETFSYDDIVVIDPRCDPIDPFYYHYNCYVPLETDQRKEPKKEPKE
jgi:hypothetical protein